MRSILKKAREVLDLSATAADPPWRVEIEPCGEVRVLQDTGKQSPTIVAVICRTGEDGIGCEQEAAEALQERAMDALCIAVYRHAAPQLAEAVLSMAAEISRLKSDDDPPPA